MQRLSRFLETFLYPLASGGEVHVGAALDAEDLEKLQLAFLPLELLQAQGEARHDGLGHRDVLTQELTAIETHCQAEVAEMWPEPLAFHMDARLMELAVAAYNLLFLSHPVGDGVRVGPRGTERVETFTSQCIQGSLPMGPEDLLRRHALLGGLLDLKRTDVEVRFWAGSRTYRGMSPPKRLTRWARVRRVRQEERQIPWLSTTLTSTQTNLMIRLLGQTPLSDVLTPSRPTPPFRWKNVTPYLSSPGICRLVCHSYLTQGLDKVGPALARGFWEMTRGQIDAHTRRSLRLAAQLITYLHATQFMSEHPGSNLAEVPAQARDPEVALGPILLAAAQCDLLPNKDTLGGDEVYERLQTWIDAWRTTLGPAAEELSNRLFGVLF